MLATVRLLLSFQVLLRHGDVLGSHEFQDGKYRVRIHPPVQSRHFQAGIAGAAGVLVPMGPRLLDELRRPQEEDGRSDLHLSQG